MGTHAAPARPKGARRAAPHRSARHVGATRARRPGMRGADSVRPAQWVGAGQAGRTVARRPQTATSRRRSPALGGRAARAGRRGRATPGRPRRAGAAPPSRLAGVPRKAARSTTLCSPLPRSSRVIRAGSRAARTWLGSGPGLGLGLRLWLRLRRRGWSGSSVRAAVYQCSSRLRRRTGLARRRSKGTRARARVRIATVRSLRAVGARRAAAACWQHSGTATTQHACTWRSIHAAGARRSRATGSSFSMNSRASQRAGELAGADPANRAPLAHPRQLAGRSWPRVRRRGARFGGGLETDHLNGRPGGREATRCARRPLCGAEDTTE